ncbi:MAG: IS110 family transposase [Pseudolabrys sp.]|nr:IS110 family transposase [Pseudolabrys sp.]
MSRIGQKLDVGIDVSSRELVLSASRDGQALERTTFENTAEGRAKLCRWLHKRGKSVRVCLEATGIYNLDVSLALDRGGIEVMVINPRVASDYAKARMQRSKTDVADADMLLDYLQRMPFVRWIAPVEERLELRALVRHIASRKRMIAEEKNRLAASEAAEALPARIANDIEVSIRHLERRIDLLDKQALEIVRAHEELRACYELLLTISGIGHVTALELTAELMMLPGDLTARQLVAHAGLDPRQHVSGTSVQRRPHISKAGNRRLRGTLFLPALAAIRHDAYVRAFYERLLAHGKKPLQAIVAVMRKLLHAVHGVLATKTPFDSARFTPLAA